MLVCSLGLPIIYIFSLNIIYVIIIKLREKIKIKINIKSIERVIYFLIEREGIKINGENTSNFNI